MARDELDALLAEQVAYYRARAPEYDATSPWPFDDAARARLRGALEEFRPQGSVLELACGTGEWTAELARHTSQLTALDASPEMLAIASARIGDERVRFMRADVFDWQPDRRYDVVTFSAWLSHVPPQHFARFWTLIDESLTARGRVFFIDELPAAAAGERTIADAPAPAVERPLRSGARYRTVKVFYEPAALSTRLAELGWQVDVHPVGWRLFYATATRPIRRLSRG
jgi:demethylmenaquinone methyltransferase/2-methoxy-6-polyprenyl-1,4-benzoquinol methylase